jgi:hypothetical protein
MQKYEVLRRHDGDKEYHEGDERSLTKAEAQHLVDLGVLREIDADAKKAEAPAANKAVKSAPKNKSES